MSEGFMTAGGTGWTDQSNAKESNDMWGGIIGGGLGLIGTAGSTEKTRTSINKQLSHQKTMSDTAHQREVKDLRAAGLNPILSSTGGPGASTTPGASMTYQDPLTPAISTAMDALALEKELENMEKVIKKTQTEADLNIQLNNESENRQGLINRQADKTATENEMNKQILKGLKVEGGIDDSKIGQITRVLNRILGTGSSARQAVGRGVLKR